MKTRKVKITANKGSGCLEIKKCLRGLQFIGHFNDKLKKKVMVSYNQLNGIVDSLNNKYITLCGDLHMHAYAEDNDVFIYFPEVKLPSGNTLNCIRVSHQILVDRLNFFLKK